MIIRKYHLLLFLIVVLLGLSWGIVRRYPASGVARFDDLVINEFVAVNRTGLSDEDGDHSDWIELYNAGQSSVNLGGWSLTDDPKNPEKWRFPDITLRGGDYLLVFASGKNRRDPNSPLHTNFKLNRSGESLALHNIFAEQFSTVDASPFPAQFKDTAYGRRGDEASYGYLNSPTPGQANAENLAWEGLVSDLAFSFQRGFYDEAIAVELFTATPGASIYYTTDGSEPTERNGRTYNEFVVISRTTVLRAVALKPGYLPSAPKSQSYIFIEDVLNQPANPAGWTQTWGTYSNSRGDYQEGGPVFADYEMDPEIVNDPVYRQMLIDGLTDIPTLSLATYPQNFDDVYSNPRERGAEWERPVSVELIFPNGEQENYGINAGFKIHGNIGRREYVFKHGFKLVFREAYGATKMDYPLFADSPVDSFNQLIVRSGVNRSYTGYLHKAHGIADHRLTTYTRDEWMRQTQIEMSGVGSRGIFVHLYLNGLYWGLYNLVERPDEAFAADYLGGDKEDWGVVDKNGPVSGDTTRFETFAALVKEGGFDNPERYALLETYFDPAQFSDYVILNFFAGNRDWGHNNWYANFLNPSGQINYFVWDAEVTWLDGADDYLGADDEEGSPNLIKLLFRQLMINPDFRITFTDRLYVHLFNNGALTTVNAMERWERITMPLSNAIVAESARWGDGRYESPITRKDWLNAYQNVSDQMLGNTEKMLTMRLDNYGWYPPFNPPVFARHGSIVSPDYPLTMTVPQGEIYYTVDGSDPRETYTGGIAPNAILYAAPPVITQTTHIKARTHLADEWSALAEATFFVDQPNAYLAITEIMYNPPDGGEYEFIELTNVGGAPFSLAQSRFEGITFVFPADAPSLLPDESVVLVRSPTAFARRYPHAPIGGVYEGQLSNKGETITLRDWQGNVIASAAYDDEAGWALSPDGSGDSLVLINPTGDPKDPKSWRASPQLHGSPGETDFAPGD